MQPHASAVPSARRVRLLSLWGQITFFSDIDEHSLDPGVVVIGRGLGDDGRDAMFDECDRPCPQILRNGAADACSVVEVEVDEIGPSLRYATAKVNRASRGGGGGGGGFGSGGGGGRGGGSNQQVADDPWGSAPASNSGGSFGGGDDEPPF